MTDYLPASMPPLPEAFCRQMNETFGAELGAQLLQSLNADPAVGIRLNKNKGIDIKEMPAAATPVAWAERGYMLAGRPTFALDPAWHQGRYYVQEPASMFAGYVARHIAEAERQQPLKLLDLCAAPGGKTTAVADALPAGSLIVANEYVAQRAEVLRENLQKWGLPDAIVTRGDTARICKAVKGRMDIVMADVPCSGEGMMRKEPEARRQWSETLIKGCVATQRSIISNAAEALRQGGWLIYSTCTFNQSENEEMIEWICTTHGFEIVSVPTDPDWHLLQIGPGYRFLPALTGSEGLYICLLRKTSVPAHSARLRESRIRNVKAKELEWIDAAGRHLVEMPEGVYALRPEYLPLVENIRREADMLYTPLAQKGKRGWEPTHSAALSGLLRRGFFGEVELNKMQALRYLSRRTDGLPESDTRGFTIATFNGLPLGWLKNLGTRYNNLYPQAWRLRINVE